MLLNVNTHTLFLTFQKTCKTLATPFQAGIRTGYPEFIEKIGENTHYGY